MKINCILIFIVLLNTAVFGQQTKSQQTNISAQDLKSLEIQISKISDQQDKLVRTNDSLMQTHQHLIAKNDSLVSLAKDVTLKLVEDEKSFSRINLHFDIIAVVLTIFTILSPIIIFTIGILPARKEAKNLKQTVQSHIISQERENINFALDQLLSDSENDRYEAAFVLSNRINFNFSDDDLRRIIEAHDQIEDSQTKFILKNVLCTKASLATDQFFRKVLKSANFEYNLYHILRYLATSKSDFTHEIIEGLKTKDNPAAIYGSIITQSVSTSFSLSQQFLNNTGILEYLFANSDTKQTKSAYEHILNTFKLYSPDSIDSVEKSEFAEGLEKAMIESKKEEEKQEAAQIERKDQKKEPDLIKEFGLKQTNGKVLNSKGEELNTVDVAQSMFGGLQEVRKAVKIGNRYVLLDTIPKGKKEG